MPIKDRLNILKKRFPEEDSRLLTLSCYLGDKVEYAKEYKQKLEVCNDYRDIAQTVVRPLYANGDIDSITAKSKHFIQVLLSLTSYGKDGKYRSVYYHIRQMLDEDEVKEERRKTMAKNSYVPQIESAEETITYVSESSKCRYYVDVTPGKENAVKNILQGIKEGGLIQSFHCESVREAHLLANKVRFSIESEKANLLHVVKRLGSYGIANKKRYEMPKAGIQRKYAPIQRRRFIRPAPIPDIVVHISPEIVEPKVYHVLNGFPGIKVTTKGYTKNRNKEVIGSHALPSSIIIKR